MKSVLALGLLSQALSVQAHPRGHASPSEAHVAKRGIDVEAFRLHAASEYVPTTAVAEAEPALSVSKRETYVETAKALVEKIMPGATFRVVDDHYVGTNGIAHVNLKQTANGLDIDNADFNVNIAADGSVFSYGHSFYTGKIPALRRRDVPEPVVALDGAVQKLGLPVDTASATAEVKDADLYTFRGTSGAEKDPEAKLVYFAKADGTLALTYRVETDVMSNWLLTYVDVATKDIHGVVDYVADFATYQVYPFGLSNPLDGSRQVETDPWVTSASPFTWHGDGTTNYTTTRGNNGIAQVNPSGGSAYLNNYRPSSATNTYEYSYSLTATDPTSYRDASITQLFYTANKYHDLLYLLGFTEPAGNFQFNNNGKGGRAADEVILSAQDGASSNNADFATPADGSKPRMRMFLWTRSTPRRDGSFDSSIVIHEYTHGLSNRLTGGPSNSGCLSGSESGGMGEGWGDFMATAINTKASDTRAKDVPMGDWAYNNPIGVRAYPYSTSLTTNPYTYKSANSLSGVHAIGTVWATMLYEVLWNLIEKHGFNPAHVPTFRNGVPTDGRYLAMKLVVDGMALQPCQPNFVQARNAILDADTALTGGANKCEIWKGFAKRGLGTGAVYSSSSRTESFALPTGC